MRHFNFYGFFTLYGILFLVIIYKVFYVPVTTDEVPTVFFYSTFSIWDIMMFPDNWPNNHILNTILAKGCITLFGKEPWSIRMPNFLMFLIYAFGVFKILKLTIKQNSWFFLPASLLFVNPYLLDFFGLCRGYGISSTFVIISVGFLMSGFSQKKSTHIWIAVISAILASYANFTVLVYWVAVTIMAWFYFFLEYRRNLKKLLFPVFISGIISLIFLAIIMVPIQKLHSTNEFQYWTSKGFYQDTVKSLVHFWRYDAEILYKINSNFYVGIISLVILTNLFYLLFKLKKTRFSVQVFYRPEFVATTILLLTIMVNISQTTILGTPNLFGRTALFFLPLLAVVFTTAIGLIPLFKPGWLFKSVAFFLGIILLANFANRVNLKSVKEWNYDQNTLQVTEYLKEKYNGKPVSLKTNWIFHPSFYFYYDSGKIPWIELYDYDYNPDINTRAEYYYIFAENYEFLEPRFEVEYKFSEDRWLLKQRKY
ncbi:hypothetical protein [Mariniphaga sp.]|uniref:hypothetical protein n=1 Tax=Mariniphaga sp. TaxID=1954475 RepID=UPI00356AC06B